MIENFATEDKFLRLSIAERVLPAILSQFSSTDRYPDPDEVASKCFEYVDALLKKSGIS
jgi:hypothetical protein